VKETVATAASFNQHGYGDDDASTSNPKVRKNKDPSNLLQNKERKREEYKQRGERGKKGRIYLLYMVILMQCCGNEIFEIEMGNL
jgi:hypothetical protein